MVKLAPRSAPMLLVLLVVVFYLADVPPVVSVLRVWVYECDNVSGNYASNSIYAQNLDGFMASMDMTNSYGFYSFQGGEAPNAVYLTSLCTGYVSVTDCHTCQVYVKSQIKSLCPNQKQAIFWSDDCMIRYSNDPIFEVMEENPYWVLVRGVTIDSSDVESYNLVVGKLLESLVRNASAGDDNVKFATGQADYNSSITIYSVAQCTPDLIHKDCLRCLTIAVSELKNQSSGQRGARFLFPSCYVRYEENKFYLSSDGAPTSVSTASSTNVGTGSSIQTTKNTSNRTKKIIVVAVSLCVLLIIAASLIFTQKRKLYPNLLTNNLVDGEDISNIESLQFKFSTTRAATKNFSEANKLGQGGFGAVYKGRLPNNGQEIAVKRLAGNSSQGEEEFKTEIKLLSKLQHRNLVRLLGFCFHNEERLLIYEFVPNASLDHFLFGATRHAHLDWETRYKIIRGISRGILYLQEDSRLRIIHRDLKASNVLLDAEMCPKIADFGTARLFDIHQTHSDTRRVVGTYGYMAPEYALHGNFSTKSDVYSFGILLLEIVCGKRCSTFFSGEISGCLISLVWKKWSEGTPLEVVDSFISDGSESEILKCIHIGLLCVQDNMADRPTMSLVIRMMSSESIALPTPLQPAYIMTSNLPLSSQDIWSIGRSTGLESITELHVR